MADLQNDIEKYLKGELSAAERHRLEKMALDDPFLADALEGAAAVGPEEFSQGLDKIHAAIESRITKKGKTVSMWYWPMRIAAGILLLICSTYLVYFFATDKTTNDLAINSAEEILPTEKEDKLLAADSITPIEVEVTLEKESTALPDTKSQELKIKKAEQPQIVPLKDDNANQPTTSPTEVVSAIAQNQVTEVVADEPDFLKSEERKEEAKAAPVSRAKKSAEPSAAAANEALGIVADQEASRIIKGKVKDLEDGTPIPGVNVTLKGTTQGTITDLDGNYELPILQSDGVLVFSFIGFATKEEKISDQLDVSLDQDISELSEVVVTGYGINDNNAIFTSNTVPDFKPAEPEGGFKAYKIYLDDNMHYPIQAIENKVQGKVTVRFEIATNGTISDFQVTKGIGFGCDEEAIRLIRQGPKWSSPKSGEEPVKGRVKVRVRFALPK